MKQRKNRIWLIKMTNKKMVPRKLPSQKRSKDKIQRILDATIRLLEDSGIEGLTTNHIAREAKISVASLYQYFPNKQAILYTIYQQWLSWTIQKLDEVENKYFMVTGWHEFFDKLIVETIENTLYSCRAESQLIKAMQSSRDLEKLDNLHGNEIADRMVRYFKGYGSKWEEKKLKKLGILLFRMTDLVYNASNTPTVEDRKLQLEWNRKMAQTLLKECLIE
jgi:AcrR family transcriptional regulator